MKIIDRDFDDIFFSQFRGILGGIIVGLIIALHKGNLFEIPGMLILIPGLLEMRGSIGGTFASRICSGLYLGIIKPDKLFTKLIRENFLATLILTATSSTVIGLVAFLVNFFILNNLNPDLILIAVLSGIIGNLIEIPLTLFVTIFYFKRGDDPNNSIGPFVSTTGDIVNILALLIAIKLV
ncbi:MAG: magnesium transporter [Patescibacteria group bacterium]